MVAADKYLASNSHMAVEDREDMEDKNPANILNQINPNEEISPCKILIHHAMILYCVVLAG